MKNKCLLLACVAGLLAGGCKPTDNPTPTVGNDTSAQLERVKEKTKEAALAVNDYAYAQRVEFADKMRAELADINAQLDRISVQVNSSTSSAKDEAKAKIQALRDKTSDLNKQLDGVKDSSESTWNDVKSGIRKGFDNVKDSFKQARQWLSDKIAP